MNRDEFNKLDVNSQVQYFNEELKKDNNNFNAIHSHTPFYLYYINILL